MGPIFISYRRGDSPEAVGRIYDRLIERFPAPLVFHDINSIPLGRPFTEVLNDAIKSTSLGLIVIGPQRVAITNEDGHRRLHDQADFVRREVESLLAKGIPVIPCLVANACMPSANDLPVSIRPLVLRQGIHVRPDPDFHRDMDLLIEQLLVSAKDIERVDNPQTKGSNSESPQRAGWSAHRILALGLVLVALSVWLGLDVGLDRDVLVAVLFIFAFPTVVLVVCVIAVFRMKRTSRRIDEKASRIR